MGLPPEGPNASSVCCHPAICVSAPTWSRETSSSARAPAFRLHTHHQGAGRGPRTNFQDGRVGCMHFSTQTCADKRPFSSTLTVSSKRLVESPVSRADARRTLHYTCHQLEIGMPIAAADFFSDDAEHPAAYQSADQVPAPGNAAIRSYLTARLTPVLVKALIKMDEENPSRPLQWLASYLEEYTDI